MGRLAIFEVQRPGKRPVSARDFANTAPLVGRQLGCSIPVNKPAAQIFPEPLGARC